MTITDVVTPIGVQGLAGGDVKLVIPFTLVSPRGVPTDVEFRYGADYDGSGNITDAEYRPLTEDRLDPRDTRDNAKPQRFLTLGDDGANHAVVWDTYADILGGAYGTLLYAFTDQGRLIPDPNGPDEFLYDIAQAGVRVRMRTVCRWRGRRWVGPWVETESFSVVNAIAPTVRIEDVVEREDGKLEITWTVFDPDTEDTNGNGRLDAGEDANGNGMFDQSAVGVAFDFHPVQEGENPPAMTEEQLEGLVWKPCTRATGEGDTDSFRQPSPTPGQPDLRVFAAPNGRTWTFVWDGEPDLLEWYDPFVLRARVIDHTKQLGPWAYRLQPFSLRE